MRVLAIPIVLLLSGCATAITQNDIIRAKGYCEQGNGGVSAINTTFYNKTVSVTCSNSGNFAFTTTGN